MTRATYLGPEAISQLREVVRRELHAIQGEPRIPRKGNIPGATPHFICRVTSEISARSGTTAGSGAGVLNYLSTTTLTDVSVNSSVTVYNADTMAIASGKYIPVQQDTYGNWWALPVGSTSTILFAYGGFDAPNTNTYTTPTNELVLWTGRSSREQNITAWLTGPDAQKVEIEIDGHYWLMFQALCRVIHTAESSASFSIMKNGSGLGRQQPLLAWFPETTSNDRHTTTVVGSTITTANDGDLFHVEVTSADSVIIQEASFIFNKLNWDKADSTVY